MGEDTGGLQAMPGDWTKSEDAGQVLALTLDQRPAWLWSAAEEEWVWRNVAAVLFRARVRKSKVKLAPPPLPIKGQIARILRMGSPGRASLSRLRFLVGRKPVSATCLCTPIELGGQSYLLTLDTESTDAASGSGAGWRGALDVPLFADGRPFVIETADGTLLADHAPEGSHDADAARRVFVLRGDGARIVLFEPLEAVGVEDAEQGADGDTAASREREGGGGLSGLVDRLAATEALFTPLDENDDYPPAIAGMLEDDRPAAPGPMAPEGADRYAFALDARGEVFSGEASPLARLGSADWRADPGFAGDTVFALSAEGRTLTAVPIFDRFGARTGWRGYAEDAAAATETSAASEQAEAVGGTGLWTLTGRRFIPNAEAATETPEDGAADGDGAVAEANEPADIAVGDRASRYNFDELSRILSDRVGGGEAGETPPPAEATLEAETGGDLVPLSDETLVLNRLPLGLLVFRDHTILFANRAMADLTGHRSTSALREAGLEALFPDAGDGTPGVGPVSQLAGAGGQAVAVVARLQSIAWQGRPAFLLSARVADSAASHPQPAGMTTRAMVELIAAQSNCGFIQLTQTGNVEGLSSLGASLLGPSRSVLLGRPLLSYLDSASKPRFAGFLAQAGADPDEAVTVIADAGAGPAEITLFADRRRHGGRAEGYLGLVRTGAAAPAQTPVTRTVSAPSADFGTVLAQLSRELRVPLNTILGFSELMMGQSGATLEPGRLAEYARDVYRAGRQIGLLVNELTDLSRLEGGRFELNETEIDLGILLETCVAQIRPQANASQIVVRGAVSQNLPPIVADRGVLTQTVMNMLASAIAVSGRGGNVVLSAKIAGDGGIEVHVRDHGGRPTAEAAEGFVVYREPEDVAGVAEAPTPSGTGLALTRSLAKANALNLSLGEMAGAGTLMALEIPPEKIVRH